MTNSGRTEGRTLLLYLLLSIANSPERDITLHDQQEEGYYVTTQQEEEFLFAWQQSSQ